MQKGIGNRRPESVAAWAAGCYAAGALLFIVLFNLLEAAGFRLEEDLALAFETYGFVLYIALFSVFLHAILRGILPRPEGAAPLRPGRALQATLYIAAFAVFLTVAVNALMYVLGGGHAPWRSEEVVKEIVVVGLTALWIYAQVKNLLAIDWQVVTAAVASDRVRHPALLQSWVPVAAFVLLGAGIINTGHFLLNKYKGEITGDMLQLLTAMSAFKAERIAEWRAEQQRDGESLAADAYLGRAFADWARSGYAAGPARQVLAQRLTALVASYGYAAAFIIDAEGKVRLGSQPSAAKPDEYDAGLAARALDQRRVLLSDIHDDGEAGQRLQVVDLLIPLAAPAEGVLYLRIATRSVFLPILRPMPPRLTTGETFLARSDRGEIVYLNDLRHRPGSALDLRISLDKQNLLAAMAVRGAEGIVEGVDYRDRPSIGAARRVPGTDWQLITKIDREELFAPVNERARKVGMLVFLSILGAGVAIFLWWRQFREHLLAVQYKKELEHIAARERAEAEIVALHADLERRVRERTAELEEINRELKAFSSSLSHDLRSPLRSILGFSRVVREDCENELGTCGMDHLDRVIAAGERMDRLIEGMLKLFRIGVGGEIERKPVDLTAMAGDIRDSLKDSDPGRMVEFVIAGSGLVIGDPALLRDVMENLIGNAWKYSARRQMARIEFGTCNGEQGETVFYVRDNGAGFDMQFAEKLFKPFQRLHRAEEFPGSGIGLATVVRILGRHGGRIWAEASVGEGATFYFTLGTA